jgi:uncharacterized membrane protein YkoI
MKISIKQTVGGLAGAAVLVLGLTACVSEKHEQANLQAQAKLTRAQAEEVALAKVPGGTIKEAELEKEKGKLIWSFDITKAGEPGTTEVNVDAVTGEVVGTEHEGPK